MRIDESTPLLRSDYAQRGRSYSRSRERLPYWRQDEDAPVHDPTQHKDLSGNNPHAQFCALVGCPPSNLSKEQRSKFVVPKKSLYGRTTAQFGSQRRAYNFSASLSNTLLLSQVILGAALTALGASASSHVLITIFGATNTIIAGLVAYLKSRGQPMRARMYRDDLERVVDEIENSEVMWRGISEGVHGYDAIDTDEITVRSEVARLTRLYERAIRLNGMNNPDLYMAGGVGDGGSGGVQRRQGPNPLLNTVLPAVTVPAPQPSGENPGPAVPIVPNPEDVAPATKAKVSDESAAEDVKEGEESKTEGKKPATDGASSSDDKNAADGPSSSKPKVEGESKPVATPPPQTAQPPAPAPAPAPVLIPVEDPDASPATAAKLKPKRKKSTDKTGDDSEGKKAVDGEEKSTE